MRENGYSIFDEPLRMDLRTEFPIPKSMRKRDIPLALTGQIRVNDFELVMHHQ